MEKPIISENLIKEMFLQVINEETSKVKREEYTRLQYKIEELQNSLNETVKELRKLEDCVPSGLKSLTNGRISSISSNLSNTQKFLVQLKEKIRQHKRSLYVQQTEEKKK